MKIQVLDSPPISGSMPEVHFDAFGDCIWVKFDEGLEEWAGVFGIDDLWSEINIAVVFDDNRHAFIVASGQGYVVNLTDRSLTYRTADDNIRDVIVIPNRDLILTCNYAYLTLYDSDKILWSSDRIASDTIKLTKATPDKVSGYLLQMKGWYSFIFDINSRALIEQNFITQDWDYFEPNHKPANKPKNNPAKKSRLQQIISFLSYLIVAYLISYILSKL